MLIATLYAGEQAPVQKGNFPGDPLVSPHIIELSTKEWGC